MTFIKTQEIDKLIYDPRPEKLTPEIIASVIPKEITARSLGFLLELKGIAERHLMQKSKEYQAMESMVETLESSMITVNFNHKTLMHSVVISNAR
jgi:hypothetical protein